MSAETNGFALSKDSEEFLTFVAGNVTGTQTFDVSVPLSLPAETVAQTVATRMSLPMNVPWALRDDESSVYLDDRRPIGEQLAPGARVTLTPKTHLG